LRRLENHHHQLDDIDIFTKPISTYNPFIVARVTTDLIKDHNDIWNQEFSGWLTDLIAALQELHAAEPHKEVRPPGN
jgi:hypothetical protein